MAPLRFALALALVLVFLYFKIRELVQTVRDFRYDRAFRASYIGLLVAIALMVGSCVVVEKLTGVSPESDPPSYAVRRALAAIFLVAWMVFIWRWQHHLDAPRRRFAEGKVCPTCNRPMDQDRLDRPVAAASKTRSDKHWAYACACGQVVLFDETGAVLERFFGV